MLIKIFIGVAVVIVLLLILIATRPAEFTVTRSATMATTPAAVFAQLNDFHKWEAWSPWAKMDPNAKNTFEGPTSGEGAKFAWDGNNDVGAGSMIITESVPDDHVRIRLEFVRPFAGVSDTLFTLKPAGDKTNVTWTMSGKNNFIGKAISLFMDCEKMIGPQFETGLANMEAVAVAESKPISAESTNTPAAPSLAGGRTASISDNEIVSERLVNASPEQIFDAYSNPERLARWWGPNGFTSTFHEFEFRPGGKWRFTLHGPDGTDYPNESEFKEIEKPNRIVLEHLKPMHRFMMTMNFTPEETKTRITWRCVSNRQRRSRGSNRSSPMPTNKTSTGSNRN